MWNKFYFGLNYCLLSRSSYHQDDGYNLRDLRDKINATIAHSEHSMNNDPESRFELQTKVNRSRSEQRNRFVFLISRHIFILTIQDLLRVTQVSRPWVGPQSVRRDTFEEEKKKIPRKFIISQPGRAHTYLCSSRTSDESSRIYPLASSRFYPD